MFHSHSDEHIPMIVGSYNYCLTKLELFYEPCKEKFIIMWLSPNMKICGMTFVDLYLDDYLYGVIPEVLGGKKISSTYLTYA